MNVVSDLKEQLDAFSNGSIDFDGLANRVDVYIKENPQASSDLMMLLDSAHEAGSLDDIQYHKLLEDIVSADVMAVTEAEAEEDKREKTQIFTKTADQGVAKVGVGSVIKGRFELEGQLGVGGMGIVYKACDLIKVEAKDRNPYVAIKVLNEDFKKHPESFITLQRECSRTQKLAHPNIATVFDFDRTGGMVYMTMELLEGKPLNDFMKDDLPEKGLSFKEAWPIIKGLGAALAFAHHRRIVHSDFKPGNAFLTKDDAVKVLDFGIARAIKKPGQSETTVFDAGKLGALTPAYASCEMLEDEPPDEQDDIYGLGVVTYILLSGRHPFDKYPATMARDHGMSPAAIPSLTRMQNKALRHVLAFERGDRTPVVEEFLAELQGEHSEEQKLKRMTRMMMMMAAGFILLALIVAVLLLK
ncbi:MAG: hypothetical protein BMS9Abin15_0624 [Gammaproteobacteria bacterium]|nr:MAG: hypothetical protein BMS9Abin15_0624 [Gammaproteobacteria bacterium]